ncbi:MAG: hypothetical protein KAI03_04610 [Candidatus Aureabacteria bacterium]|nr:hypothetical protein [Candidatus Auribacterota bacterium]
MSKPLPSSTTVFRDNLEIGNAKKLIVFLSGVLFLNILSGSPCHGGILRLKNGGDIRGIIQEVNDSYITVKVSGGQVRVPRTNLTKETEGQLEDIFRKDTELSKKILGAAGDKKEKVEDNFISYQEVKNLLSDPSNEKDTDIYTCLREIQKKGLTADAEEFKELQLLIKEKFLKITDVFIVIFLTVIIIQLLINALYIKLFVKISIQQRVSFLTACVFQIKFILFQIFAAVIFTVLMSFAAIMGTDFWGTIFLCSALIISFIWYFFRLAYAELGLIFLQTLLMVIIYLIIYFIIGAALNLLLSAWLS